MGRILEVGLNAALHVREEKLSARADAFRLLYVSDIHLRKRRTDLLSRQVLQSAARCAPDAVLLGGDLVDRRDALPSLVQLVQRLGFFAPVFAVGGNHDGWIGMVRVREAVEEGGGRWIHDGAATVTHRARVIAFCGPEFSRPDPGAHTSAELDADVRVLCAHNPRVWTWARHAGYDLVLAGHLHGFQVVACEYRGRLFPGAFFYPYCVTRHRAGASRLIVSRGVSDLLPIRWRCPREVVLCHV